MSKHSYLEAVLEGIKAVSAVDVAFRPQSSDVGSQKNSSLINHTCSGSARKKIYVRLLLSIDRRETTEAAMETVCDEMYYEEIFEHMHFFLSLTSFVIYCR